MAQVACGIDIGGSGVKGALVDLETGEYIGNQVRIPTPDPATPDAVAAVCREVVDQLDVKIGVPIGVTFPAPVFDGVIVFTTQGTGIGSAIIVNGTLLTNTELGHLEIDGTDAEKNASSGQKTLQGLDWEQWAQRLQRYYGHVEFLLNPDLFVVGGGVSENHEKFMPLLDLKTPMIPAKLLNTAGIVGAAYYAAQHSA